MFNVGGGEILVILLVALVVLGPDKLPGAMRSVGNMVGEIRKLSNGFQAEVRTAMYADDRPKPQSPGGPIPGNATDAAGPVPGAEATPNAPEHRELPSGDDRPTQ